MNRAADPSALRVRLAPELPRLASLGVEDAGELLDLDEPVPRTRVEARAGDYERLRLPLPGTPLEPGGPMTSAPAGAGTGFVVLERWRGTPLGRLLSARLSAPRSLSVAERHWNLLCHLRAHGVGTPEPLAVGARGRGLVARESFLVTRELEEGSLRLDRFVGGDGAAVPSDAALDHAADALAATVRALAGAGVVLPTLDARGLWVRFSRHAPGLVDPAEEPGCGLSQLATWREERALGGLRRDPRPAVLVSAVEGGRLAGGDAQARREALLAALRPPAGTAPDRATEARWRRLAARVRTALEAAPART